MSTHPFRKLQWSFSVIVSLAFLMVTSVQSLAGENSQPSQADQPSMLSVTAMQSALEFVVAKVNAISTTTDQGPHTGLQERARDVSSQISRPLPDYEFAGLLNTVLAPLQDAHTFVELGRPQKRLPGQVVLLREGLIATETTGLLVKGDRIVKMGRFPISEMMERLKAVTPHENDFFVGGVAPLALFREDFLRSLEVVTQEGYARLELERQGRRRLVLLKLEPELPPTKPWYRFSIDEKSSLAQVWLDRCDYNAELADALRSFMGQVKAKKIEKLVIDLRSNHGGDALIAFAIAAYIKPEHRSFALQVRRSSDLVSRVPAYGQFLNDSNRLPGSQNLHELSSEIVKAVSLARLGTEAHVDPSLRFDGKVFVLTSPFTFSSANLFATLFKDNNMATIVGEPTGNEVEFRGEGVLLDIPNTPLRLSVSATRYQRPDQTRANGVTLMPDVFIPSTRAAILNEIDPQLEAIRRGFALPKFQTTACVGDDTGLSPRCGYVSVPENRLRPDGPQVRLAVRVFRRLDLSSREAPLVYLHGGPGTSGIAYEGQRAFNFESRILPFLEKRDVILFDQRGVGLSSPSLDCPEFADTVFPRAREFVHREQYMPTMLAAASACAARLRGAGVQLESFNSNESAEDADDIRRALQIETWNLMGNSYGTRLGLNILRRHPEGVRSAVLSSLHPPQLGFDAQARFAKLVERYFAQYPELQTQMDRLVPQLNEQPLRVTTSLPFAGFPWSGRAIAWLFSGDQLSGLLYGSLYSPVSAQEFRNLVGRLANGNSEGLDVAISKNFVIPMSLVNIGSLLATNCNDRLSQVSREELRRSLEENPLAGPLMYGRDLMWGEDLVEMCHAFVDPRASDPKFSLPVRSEVPSLLVSGEFDSATPPENAALAAQTLPRSQSVVVPRAGHAPLFEGTCPKSVALKFLENPLRQIDTDCLARVR